MFLLKKNKLNLKRGIYSFITEQRYSVTELDALEIMKRGKNFFYQYLLPLMNFLEIEVDSHGNNIVR